MSEPITRNGEIVGPGADDVCANCGTTEVGAYCSHCGQRSGPGAQRDFRLFLAEVWSQLIGLDSMTIRSLAALVTAPGAMTVDYLEGRR